jgi:CBS domain-containing protein
MSKIKDFMTETVHTVFGTDPINMAMEILIEHNITGLPVINKDKTLIGILSEKDILDLVFKKQDRMLDLPVSHFMTSNVTAFDETDDLEKVCTCLIKRSFRRVPILREGKLVGIVTRRDILKSLMSMNDMDVLELML